MLIEQLVESQRSFFKTNRTKDLEFRIQALKTLKAGVLAFEEEINEALMSDLHKSSFETYMSETGVVLAEIDYALKHIRKWAKHRRRKTPLPLFLANSYVSPEPYGVTLIMSPWNYPFQLAIDPLVGAIAAGNTAIIKPASYAQNTSNIIKVIIEHCFAEEYVSCVLGGRDENTLLLEQKFDYIFFTGSTSVGKIVMEKASKNLTPISLELGGKSPCIIDSSVNLRLVARRVAFGKFLNSGQTCVAPDYIYMHESQIPEFVENIKREIFEFFGEKPLLSEELPKIINQKHLERLKGLMIGEKIVAGGNYNKTSIEPTVLTGITIDSRIMQEEIFGPILPILTYQNLSEVYDYLKSQPKPLALYLFTNSKNTKDEVFKECSFGGATINDTIMHFATSEMGFGGVGDSGIGKYHGTSSFDTFSNLRSVVKRSNLVDLNMRYHPYTKGKLNLLKKFLK
ncbi:MAG: aldehyde dehydrogenase [Candidatus Izemoplasmatales bacterium]|jgi:aldehyde dehydrogenase (NAD+)|nr:aldehyde dehydrogenase [Candidatus Izemoplasmatales bacterium]